MTGKTSGTAAARLGAPRLERLLEFAEILSQQNSFAEILRVTAQKTASLLQAELSLILMLNPRTQQTVKTMFREGGEISHPRYRSVQNQLSGWLMKHRQPLLVADLKHDPRFTNVILGELAIKSVVGVPLLVEGVVIGSLILFNKRPQGAFDASDLLFLSKVATISSPYLRNVQKIQNYFAAPLPEAALLARYEALGLLGKSRRFIELLQAIEAAARCDVRVLLQGESGTGKEQVARAIHKLSARAPGPFVAIDCGAIPPHLLESELFGHVKGAFTDAKADRKGLLEEADGGTLFMDEIANLPAEMQAKFLRVLQEGEVRPVGSNRARKIDVRIVSASSESLKELVVEKRFREDLFYRIYVYPINIPTLNDRPEDIPLLADHFLHKFASLQNKQTEAFDQEIMEFMRARRWSGNIRELENFVQRLVTLAPQGLKILRRKMLPEELQREWHNLKFAYDDALAPKSLTERLADYEAQLIREALDRHDWNQSRAARALKIPVQTLRYKMKKLGIVKPN
ncbi:MAG: sigma-54-dependent Fis family transcriptional regulator [Calditrichaeota bacterium]|nr:MAG: sigma-54-dependent Fis family transcriptional regulator [Calditrichota bacterium]